MDIFSYLNTTEFRKAFHVYEGKGTVSPSAPKVFDNFKTQAEGSIWIYDIFAKYGYKMLYIAGDTDGLLSLPGTWKWIKDRKFTVKTPWTPWFSKYDGQLAGFIKEYDQNFTFATIHGEGHSGIIDRADLGPDLILKFVLGQSLA